ncbi:MAG: FHA domain-containing protein [Phycisphaerales bacterium JB039]
MPSLTIVSGPNEGDYYPLGNRTMVIGRQESCPIQVADDRVSRKHMQIRAEAGKHFAFDMNSANGVFVNGRQIHAEIELADGDEITIGSSMMSYSTRDFPDRASALEAYKQRGQRSRPTIEQ